MSTRFILTAEHIKLLRRMCVGWQDCDTGAPEIDPKRPYGNSYVAGDVHEILTGERDYALTEGQERAYLAIHRETETALQVVLSVGGFEPGEYVSESYTNKWRRA